MVVCFPGTSLRAWIANAHVGVVKQFHRVLVDTSLNQLARQFVRDGIKVFTDLT